MNKKQAPTEGQSSEQTASLATSDDAACYPADAGWWWAEASDGSFIPVSVELRGPRKILSACIPRCSTHCNKWWRPLKAINGKWRGRVQLPLDNVKDLARRALDSEETK